MKNLIILLQAAEGGGGIQDLFQSPFIMLFAVLIVFYFFFIRPQQKKSKDQKKFREALKKGDKILTIGGIHGKISEVKETTVVIEVGGGQTKMTVEKSAITNDPTSVGQTKQ